MYRKFAALLLIVVLVLLTGCEAWEPIDLGPAPTAEPTPLVDTVVPIETPVAEDTEPTDTEGLNTLLAFLLTICTLIPAVPAGAPAFAAIIDIWKRLPGRFGLKNGWAPLVSGLLNLALFTALFFLNNEGDKMVESLLGAVTALSPYILMLFVNLLATAGAHDKLVGIGVGKSHSGEAIHGMLRAG